VEADTEAEARDLFDLHLTFLMPAFDGDNPGMWLYEWDAELEEGQAITCELLHRNLAASPST
jgi:hypothetical protein